MSHVSLQYSSHGRPFTPALHGYLWLAACLWRVEADHAARPHRAAAHRVRLLAVRDGHAQAVVPACMSMHEHTSHVKAQRVLEEAMHKHMCFTQTIQPRQMPPPVGMHHLVWHGTALLCFACMPLIPAGASVPLAVVQPRVVHELLHHGVEAHGARRAVHLHPRGARGACSTAKHS